MAVETQMWTASDGVELACHRLGGLSGDGARTVVLLHGLFSSADVNWIKYGHAAKLAEAGLTVVMPDLRAHGQSAKPHDPAAYPLGVLARDLAELIAHLGLADYALGGFSLGSRTVVQAVGQGATPRRVILGGMGLEGLRGWLRRKHFFIEVIDRFDTLRHGDPHWLAAQFMKTMKIDRVAARCLLETFEDAKDEWLRSLTMPTMLLCGAEDHDNGSAPKLAEALPNATYVEVPGTHMSSVTRPELGAAMAGFFTAP